MEAEQRVSAQAQSLILALSMRRSAAAQTSHTTPSINAAARERETLRQMFGTTSAWEADNAVGQVSLSTALLEALGVWTDKRLVLILRAFGVTVKANLA